eukprot:scaffold884_cov398-Prasinococcus_capsulatus_cf.AAC.8
MIRYGMKTHPQEVGPLRSSLRPTHDVTKNGHHVVHVLLDYLSTAQTPGDRLGNSVAQQSVATTHQGHALPNVDAHHKREDHDT